MYNLNPGFLSAEHLITPLYRVEAGFFNEEFYCCITDRNHLNVNQRK